MLSTMQDVPLTITSILKHGSTVYGRAVVAEFDGTGTRSQTFAETGRRAARLANALTGLGVEADDRVATFQWNNIAHTEAYLAVPSMGAILHTLNIRLFPEQLVYIANHAQDKVVIVDASLIGMLAGVVAEFKTVQHILVVHPQGQKADTGPLAVSSAQVHDYDELLAAADDSFDWPEIDERQAAAMCYTSGTTGNPKGVVYSHRSAWLHSMASCTSNAIGMGSSDRVLPIVPMFHANAWGLIYAAFMSGADLVHPDRFLQAEPLARLIAAEKITVSGAVPTIWNDMRLYAEKNPVELSSLRLVACGGSAVPRSLMEHFQEKFDVTIQQAWGMTETSPLASVAAPPADATPENYWDYRATAGRFICGVEGRVTTPDGEVLPSDGETVGELEVRGPWVTASYYLDDDPEKFDDGWLRTGDVGHIDEQGYLTLTDRAKDVIKSGGEWISSVDLENELMSHPEVVEAAVVGVPDERWGERPLACVVPKPGSTVTLAELKEYLATKIAKWQVPERWAIVDAVPRTSVGKFDKKVLRARNADGDLTISTP